VKVGDLVKYVDGGRGPNDFAMTNGVVVGFDKENDPIVFFTCRSTAAAYYENDIEVLNESG
tara:strand:- start:320 stop:502 length:183 start_codon:yes stop_codon:yes gene_type:complete